MKQNRRPSVLPATSLAIFVAASLTTFAEGRIFLVNRLDQGKRMETIRNDGFGYGPSTFSKRLYLNDCLEALTSVRGRALPAADQAALAATCRQNARKITSTNPTNGFAFYVASLANASLDDKAAFNDELASSRDVSPYEGWLAQLRVGLADGKKELLDADGRAVLDSDINTMAQSSRGVRWLAHKAVIDTAFREHAVAIIETLPAKDRRAFVNAFRAAANRNRRQ